MSNQNPHTVCVIGGGMSGLFTGALLAKNGYKVTVLEKNHIIGGGLQSFRRGDAMFNTGMQVFVGYNSNLALKHIFHYLDIDEKSLGIVSTASSAQEIVWIDTDHSYHLPRGREKYEEYLILQFPQQSKGIHRFLDAIYEIGNSFDYFFLSPIVPHKELVKYANLTAEQLIRQYLSDENLIKLLGYASIHIGHDLSHATAIELGMILMLYIEGSCHLTGGNIKLAELLAEIIENNGGKVLNNTTVCRIYINDQTISTVEDTNNNFYTADIFIGAISPKLLLDMSHENLFRRATLQRIEQYKSDFSGCAVFIQFKKESFPYINSSLFMPCKQQEDGLPLYINAITPKYGGGDKWANTMEIYVPCRYEQYKQWEDTKIGNRGLSYEKKKQEFAVDVIDYVSRFYPSLQESIENVYVGSSLTLRDFYGNINGATYSQQGLFIPIKTRMTNLFMTGQAVMYQGLLGVATTSIIVAETILQKSLIKEIAKV